MGKLQVVQRGAGREIDKNRRSRPARCEMNWENAESKERRFRNP